MNMFIAFYFKRRILYERRPMPEKNKTKNSKKRNKPKRSLFDMLRGIHSNGGSKKISVEGILSGRYYASPQNMVAVGHKGSLRR